MPKIFYAFSEVCAENYLEISRKFSRFFGSLCRNFIQKLAEIKALLLFFRKIIKTACRQHGFGDIAGFGVFFESFVIY